MTAERRAQIVRLLATRDDHLPVPAARPLSTAGFVHRSVARESCPDCFGESPGRIGCETCRGRGYLEARRGRDPYDTGQSLGVFGESSRRHEATAERDREIARLAAQVAPPRSEADLTAEIRPEPWEAARSNAWAQFDYALLDLALEELRAVWEHAYHAIMAVHVYRWRDAGQVEQVVIDRGLDFLGWFLPDALRAPKAEPDPPTPEPPRDSEIRRLIRDGAAAQWVARRFGLSVSQVNRIASGRMERA